MPSSEVRKNPSKPKKERPDKVDPSEVEDQLVRFLRNDSPRFSDWLKVPRMDHEFKLVRSEGTGTSIILAVKDNTAKILTQDQGAEMLRGFLLTLPATFAPFYINGSKAQGVIKSFVSGKPHLNEMPKAVGFKSDPELVLHRLDFDPINISVIDLQDKAPRFSGMLARMGNHEAFLARIGSIFDPKADRKQGVWIFGPPDAGKSQIAFILSHICPRFAILGGMDFESSYFKAMLLGNRIGLVMEASAKFIRSDEFKATTGDGLHAINQKFQPIFNAKLDVLYFFFSNESPEIPHDDSLMARVIACKMESIPEGEERIPEYQFQADLLEEMPYIVGAAVDMYQEIKSGERIPCSMGALIDSIESYEEEYYDCLTRLVRVDKTQKVTFSEMTRLFENQGYRSNFQKAILKRILRKTFGVTEHYCRLKNSDGDRFRAKVYEGIGLSGEAKRFLETISFIKEVPED